MSELSWALVVGFWVVCFLIGLIVSYTYFSRKQ